MTIVTLTILGEPASKANSRRLVPAYTKNGKRYTKSIRSGKAMAFAESFQYQVRQLDPLLEGDLCIAMRVFYRTRRPDLDESIILDALQGLIYKNDRQIKQKLIAHGIDRDNPRTEIIIWPMDNGLPFFDRALAEISEIIKLGRVSNG